MSKRVLPVLLAFVTLAVTASCSPAIRGDRDTLFQVSTIGALMQGVYDGDISVRELKPYGDIGIGTFQGLNGEMIVLDGRFYRARLDGSIEEVSDDTRIPFAELTFFDRDTVVNLDQALDINGFQSYVDTLLPSVNIFYVIRVDGKFSYMKTRSMPAQQKPYPVLAEAAKGQQVREFNDVEGTMIGVRCPPYVDGVNVPGYHFHFIDKNRKFGGHVLDCKIDSVQVAIDNTANMIMELPGNKDFNKANLGQGQTEGLKQVEQGK